MDYFYSPFKLVEDKGGYFSPPYTHANFSLFPFPFSLFPTKETGPRLSLYMLLYLVEV